MKYKGLSFLLILWLFSCAGAQLPSQEKTSFTQLDELSAEERSMANDLLSFGLEHEAVYTMLGSLKPMSSLGYSLSYPIAKKTSMADGDKHVVQVAVDSVSQALDELNQWHNIVSKLSNNELQFVLIPYKNTWKEKRNLQILVCNRTRFSQVLEENESFFGQWGFTANSDPAVVLTTIEFESKNDRYRAYGYLFGYPEHAVDFFVEASIAEEETGEFVKRDFFQIPVSASETGYFTYATPKGYTPTKVDSSIYRAANAIQKSYQNLKKQHLLPNGNLNAIGLLSDYLRQTKAHQ